MSKLGLTNLLKELRLESFDYDCFTFSVSSVDGLDAFQVGYAFDPTGSTLSGAGGGDWRQNWIVVAQDFSGDPVFVDVDLPDSPVFTALHGEGTWSPWQIAPSLRTFATLLRRARALAAGRDSPIALESNPITVDEREAFQALVEANGASSDYWLAMFQDLGD
jgi:hypothetical protein